MQLMERVTPVNPAYGAVITACIPTVPWWGRMKVSNLENIPLEGPLLACNHESYWDPIAIGMAALPRR
jgi:1-acyl-sn-glycerol-3-phosphate acyltransferase